MPEPPSNTAVVTYGETVYTALLRAQPGGLTTIALQQTTGLSLYRVRKGLTYIRDHMALASATALIWDRENGYQLSTGVENCTAYIITAYASLVTRAGRLLYGTVGPHAAANPADPQAQLFFQLLNSALAALTIAMNQEPPVEAAGRQAAP